jgi:glutathione S-transferase
VLLRELAVPFREHLVPFGGAADPDVFRHCSPTGKVPCLIDGEITVWDSLAITEYVGVRHAGVWPAEPLPRAFARCATDAFFAPVAFRAARAAVRRAAARIACDADLVSRGARRKLARRGTRGGSAGRGHLDTGSARR